VLRRALLAMSGNRRLERLLANTPVSRSVVARFVPGPSLEDAVRVTKRLVTEGFSVSLDHLGEDTTDVGRAEAATKACLAALARLADEGLAGRAEVSLKLSAIGQALDHRLALDNAHVVCVAAERVGTTVTLDMEDHRTTDSTLDVLGRLRERFPGTGAVLQAYLHRTLDDCRALAYQGSRVRLCKGAYREPDSVAFQSRAEVARSYVRCLRVLMAGAGYPMVATHDPRLIAVAGTLAAKHGRRADDHEYQMLYGVRPDEQRRLLRSGHALRVYLPYGDQWYGYLMRRLAERPANVGFFLRALASRS
jgi:proline dehydrogenase